MTAPTLTSEQQEAQKAMRQALAAALHDGIDGDLLIEAGMGVDNEGQSVAISEVRVKELVWWAVYQVAPAVAAMVADAAHEAEAIKAAAIRVLQVAQPDGADEDGFITGYRFKTGALHALAAQLPGNLLMVPNKDANRIDALAKELADLRGAVEALADGDGWELADHLRALLNASSNP